MLQDAVSNARLLDLFAGSGAMGIEALSRGAAFVMFVDREKEAIACIKKNLASLNVDARKTRLFHSDASRALKHCAQKRWVFDLIIIDPPYNEMRIVHPLLTFIERYAILAPEGRLFVEGPSRSPTPPFVGDHLHLVRSRTSGNTQLQEYIHENRVNARDV